MKRTGPVAARQLKKYDQMRMQTLAMRRVQQAAWQMAHSPDDAGGRGYWGPLCLRTLNRRENYELMPFGRPARRIQQHGHVRRPPLQQQRYGMTLVILPQFGMALMILPVISVRHLWLRKCRQLHQVIFKWIDGSAPVNSCRLCFAHPDATFSLSVRATLVSQYTELQRNYDLMCEVSAALRSSVNEK